ncbi:hypothetical protein HPP92_010845 [Vanilla planifolia]|uniref:Mediator complex subunit 15 KIX domain-containing protein n=1 Tax=Vanilla planifolia TaxID=51239 RepID=A0A835R4I3_VANPL|nr:hypothetical protein HPP92_010845 [Vanilla planifolia]
MEAPPADWRSQLQPDVRQKVMNKIMDTLVKHLHVAVPEGMNELKKIAVRFEEKIYTAAVSKMDYLHKISMKMVNMENKTQQATPMTPHSSVSQHTADQVGLQGVRPQGQSLPPIPMGAAPDIYAQRQMQEEKQQQSALTQNQRQPLLNPLLYTNHHQSQFLKQKILSNVPLQPPMPRQQPLLQTNQPQSSQQSTMQMSSFTSGLSSMQQSQPTNIQYAPQSIIQQNQLNSVQHSVPSLLPQHVQTFAKQAQHTQPFIYQQTSSMQQQSAGVYQQSNLQTQQHQQLLGQHANVSNTSNVQHNQMTKQQNNTADIKPQQSLLVHTNNLVNMQQLRHQQSLSLHQQPLCQLTDLQGLPQTESLQQQQLLASLSQQPHQHSMQLQQSKHMSQLQQQLQQQSLTLLQSQGQQSHDQPSQQQLISQFQPQSEQIQQPLTMQQQPNSMQREMPQCLQASGTLLQPQSEMEQQNQVIHSQKGAPEVSSSTSVASATQSGHVCCDWQEELYEKIQSMKEVHFAEVQEFHQMISGKIQEFELMPRAKRPENYEKLKNYKLFLERMMAFLQISKIKIPISLKVNLPVYEKQMLHILSSSRRAKFIHLQQQGQQQVLQPSAHAHSAAQHQVSQVLQLQQHDKLGKQVQQMNMQGSNTSVLSAAASSMEHESTTLLSSAASVSQQNVTDSVPSASGLDPEQVNSIGIPHHGSFNTVQESVMGTLNSSLGASNQTNFRSLSQSSLSVLQPIANSIQNSNVLQQQHLKQQVYMIQNQQLKQQLQQCQIQQLLQQQQQQRQNQKQQPSSRLPVQQLSQLHPLNDLSQLKTMLGHQRYKSCAPNLTASPQNQQASSPQISHHSSLQIDQHNLLPTLAKTGTPMQTTDSTFVIPSPSTSIAPSPQSGNSEKFASSVISTQATGQSTNHHGSTAPPKAQSISVTTPGISASPLLAEFTTQESNQPVLATSGTSALDRPIERLIKMVQSLPQKSLNPAVTDIISVVSMIDQFACLVPGNGSKAAIGEDLVATTKCHLQARNMSQDGSVSKKKMKRQTSEI